MFYIPFYAFYDINTFRLISSYKTISFMNDTELNEIPKSTFLKLNLMFDQKDGLKENTY